MYEIAEHVRSVADSDGTTLLDLKTNLILGLNSTGALIWTGLQDGVSTEQIVHSIVEGTGVDQITAERDTQEFIGVLVEKGLIATKALTR
jgi:hypothetical protein